MTGELRIGGQLVGEVTDVIIDYKGPKGDRLFARREPDCAHEISGQITAFFDGGFEQPNSLIVPLWVLFRLARPHMTRRGFRRWRARLRARARA